MTEAYQAARRAQVEQVVTAEEWEKAILAMLKQIAKGNVKAFSALAPYVMGASPKEITVRVDIEARLREDALAAGIDPDEAVVEAQRILAGIG